MMPFTREDWALKAAKLASVSSEFTFMFSKCATDKQVNWRQNQLSRPIPGGIRELACGIASRLELRWELLPEIVSHDSFHEEFLTSGDFAFNFFETDLAKLEGWEHSFTHWQEYRTEANPFDFAELFPVFGIMNGDLIIELIGDRERGAIYYLDHESGSADWKRLAGSYAEFLTTLADLWFPSIDWYDSLEKFYDPVTNRLSPDTPFAKRWKTFMAEVISTHC
jgi:hypothetical protein